MKYAIQCLMRFSTKEERDLLFSSLEQKLKSEYKDDDAYIQSHKCYHDEDPNRPCEEEEKIVCSAKHS